MTYFWQKGGRADHAGPKRALTAPATMRTTPWRFGLKFIVGFVLLTAAFESSRGTAFERFLVEDFILKPTVSVINTLSPADHVELSGRTFVSGASRLRITRGCEGIEMFLLLLSAILAFPASLPHRARGLLLGSALAYLLTVARLITLHYVLRHRPGAWEALHGLVLPLAPVILISLFFMRWSARGAAREPMPRGPNAA
jgi:exosortase family protein XrtM